jgi:hypothetical protein
VKHKKSKNLQHLIRSFADRCWSERTEDLSRLWLGTWSATLSSMLLQSPDAPMKMFQQAVYIDTIRALTKPLIDAYYSQLTEVIAASPLASATGISPSSITSRRTTTRRRTYCTRHIL